MATFASRRMGMEKEGCHRGEYADAPLALPIRSSASQALPTATHHCSWGCLDRVRSDCEWHDRIKQSSDEHVPVDGFVCFAACGYSASGLSLRCS